MTTPVFVIHGIANRDPEEFAGRVARLAASMGQTNIYPVFWGDLGADHHWIASIVPAAPSHPARLVRGDGYDDAYAARELADVAMALVDGDRPLTPSERIDCLLRGLREVIDDPGEGGHPVRSPADDLTEQVVAAVEDLWASPDFEWLWSIGDADLLAEIGATMGHTVLELVAQDAIEVRGATIKAIVGAVMRGADRTAAATMGTAAARFTSWVRVHAGPAVAQNLGDLLVYQGHREKIHHKIRERIAEVAGERAGRDDAHRIHLVGHSLGAVIAMDLATAHENPIYTESIVTFGSQWPLLHLWHPSGTVPPYRGQPVCLPATVRRWTNLWERLDLMAFLAAPAFALSRDGASHDGPPRDVELHRGYAKTLFTHSVYWESPQLLAELADAWQTSLVTP